MNQYPARKYALVLGFEVYGDGCTICGEKDKEKLQLHHIIPRKEGGSNRMENLLLVCMRCHRLVHKTIGWDRTTTRLLSLEARIAKMDNDLCQTTHSLETLDGNIGGLVDDIYEFTRLIEFLLKKLGVSKKDMEEIKFESQSSRDAFFYGDNKKDYTDSKRLARLPVQGGVFP